MKKDIIIAIDIGGTTFESAMLDRDYTNIIDISDKWHVRDYNTSESLLEGICKQIKDLLSKKSLDESRVRGLSVACPGPLDSRNGIILNTPNLTLFRNYKLKDKLRKFFDCKVIVENDANLFALGEWSLSYQEEDVFLGVTVGTGLGFGIIFNGKIFTGANGMAAEYGISSCEWGTWEDKISLHYVRSQIEKAYGEKISPRKIQEYAENGDSKAQSIYNEFGENLGIALSHAINMVDPGCIVLGGGLSNAFNVYSESLKETLNNYSPIYKINPCKIRESKFKSKSQMVGAALNLKRR